MPSRTMASRMLDAADMLLREGSGSTAFRRRAVSTAYYAVFHALAKLCADYLTRSTRRTTDEYARVYRALDHGPLKTAFSQSPLKDKERLNAIGTIVVRLQAERHKADYLPPVAGRLSIGEAQELIDQAREAVAELERLNPDEEECRLMAVSLLFKERRA